MAGFTRTAVIDRPPEAVFAFVTDLHRAPEWVAGFVKAEPWPTGPLTVGTRWTETRRSGRHEAAAEVEVVEHAGPAEGGPPYRHAFAAELMGVRGVYHYLFEEAGAGRTRVELRAEVTATKMLARMLVAPAAQAMETQDGDQLQALERALEGGGD